MPLSARYKCIGRYFLFRGNIHKTNRTFPVQDYHALVRKFAVYWGLVGSGMSLEYVITGADGEWYIEKQAQDRFRDLQQRTVTAEGRLEREELALLNGQKIARLTLREVSIIEIE